MDFHGMTPAQAAAHERRLMPRRRQRVAEKCPDGHAIRPEPAGREALRQCRGCGYYECELKSWGLLATGG